MATNQEMFTRLGLTFEHKHDIKGIEEYFGKHRINEMFNEIMTNILHEQPEDPKLAILQHLQQMRTAKAPDSELNSLAEPFLVQEDMEAMFDAYDVLGTQNLPMAYLYHAMEIVGVKTGKEIIQERYSEVLEEETVNKVTFVYILQEEHKRLGYKN